MDSKITKKDKEMIEKINELIEKYDTLLEFNKTLSSVTAAIKVDFYEFFLLDLKELKKIAEEKTISDFRKIHGSETGIYLNLSEEKNESNTNNIRKNRT